MVNIRVMIRVKEIFLLVLLVRLEAIVINWVFLLDKL